MGSRRISGPSLCLLFLLSLQLRPGKMAPEIFSLPHHAPPFHAQLPPLKVPLLHLHCLHRQVPVSVHITTPEYPHTPHHLRSTPSMPGLHRAGQPDMCKAAPHQPLSQASLASQVHSGCLLLNPYMWKVQGIQCRRPVLRSRMRCSELCLWSHKHHWHVPRVLKSNFANGSLEPTSPGNTLTSPDPH